MTRINLIDPIELMDQHLIAEYRETPMIPASLSRSLKSIKNNSEILRSKIPFNFTLNTGHVSFFYDKGYYLEKRYHLLIKEMKRRGMNPNKDRSLNIDIFKDHNLYGDWTPRNQDYIIIHERLKIKIDLKPKWYRYMGLTDPSIQKYIRDFWDIYPKLINLNKFKYDLNLLKKLESLKYNNILGITELDLLRRRVQYYNLLNID